MQIHRIKTLNEIDGSGSDLITKDYFESNPVFYYCYRIFPFERGHGIFVANSIRRFLLYEIPTIAITSVLIRTVKEKAAAMRTEGSPEVGLEMGSEMESTKLAAVSSPTLVKGPQSITKPSAAQLKKKKVTKKALKEQAAELFSYTSDPFAAAKEVGQSIDTLNIHEVDLMSGGNEVSSNTNNQQSHQEVSSLTEFTTIPFVRESFLEILLNLKACVFENSFAFGEVSSEVLKGKLILNATQESLDDLTEVSQELFFQTESSQHPSEGVQGQVTEDPDQQSKKVFPQGRRVREYKIWAKDLILPPGLKVKNHDLVLATLVAPKTNCELELSFEKIFQPDLTTLSMKTGRPHHRAEQQRRNVPIDGTLFPIKKVNFALSYTKFQKEVVTFEIWTNGSINPKAAIFQCVEKILTLFQNLRESEVKEIDSFAETAADEFE